MVDPVVNARIVYWGVSGAGKSTNLEHIHRKLRPDHRGELSRVPTPEDPSVHYEVMPIELGRISGMRTRLQVIASPGGPDHESTRKQLLDRVDGIVLVLDSRRERFSENLACVEELRKLLRAYGREFGDVPVVLQYNRRDETDSLAVEDLHRKLGIRAAAFEAVAPRGTGVLECLTTISKRVVRIRREADGLTQPPIEQPATPEAPAPLVTPAQPTSAPQAPPPPTPSPTVDALGHVDGESTQPEPEADPGVPADAGRRADSAAAAIDTAARRAEHAFETNWDEATGGFDARTRAPEPLELQLLGAGEACVEDGSRVSLPLRVVDQDGREGEIRVTIDLGELLEP